MQPFASRILRLQKQRQLEKLKRKWWDENRVACPPETRDQGLDLSSLTGTFIVMGGGVCLGLVVLGVEFLLSRRTRLQLVSRCRCCCCCSILHLNILGTNRYMQLYINNK